MIHNQADLHRQQEQEIARASRENIAKAKKQPPPPKPPVDPDYDAEKAQG